MKTKACSKAAKLRAKRKKRRIKLEDNRRQQGEQSSRAKGSSDKIALEARARLMGLSLEQARDPRSATNLGRLVLLNEKEPGKGITPDQYDAIVKYLHVVNEYKQALLSPGAEWEKGVILLNDNGGYEKWYQRAVQRYDDVNKALVEGQRDNPHANFEIIIKHVILRDIAMSHYMVDLRLLCDILYRHFNPQKINATGEKAYIWRSLSHM
ncbi:hypothetical protein [Bartonella queenslandensis]|uniref:hypothetical protein n=1 Tax=Bartonella queenslandensis TaxID=481138 RepID=UPI0009FF23AE|nr:hypothetical protein [Bartonella queenslandensis]